MTILAGLLAGVAWLGPLLSGIDPLAGTMLAITLTAAVAWRGAATVTTRLAERRATQLQARIGLLLHASADGVIGVDAERKISVFNVGAERMFGFMAAEVIGQDLGVLLPASYRAVHGAHVDRFVAGTADARRMGDRNELVGRRGNGEEFPVEISIARAGADDDLVMVAVVRDASERRRTEAELRNARDQADAGARAKSEFLANMSHEIRTPMNAVVGLTGLLLESPLTAEQRRYVEIVRSSTNALRAVIDDILDYSKIETGRLEIEREPFDPRDCVKAALDLLSVGAADKGIVLRSAVDDAVPPIVVGDMTRLRQVIVNLVGNAIKFTSRGEVFVSVGAVSVDAGDVELEIAVRDSGIGIAPDRRAQIFGAFSQAEASTTRKFGGTGLGLAITKRLAELMGGRVWFESEAGVGSTFHAVLRMGRGAAASLRRPQLVACGTPPDHDAVVYGVSGVPSPAGATGATGALTLDPGLANRHPLRILLAEDNPVNQMVAVQILSRMGYVADVVPNGRDAVDAAAARDYDLILMDVQMPEMDGLEAAQRVRQLPKRNGHRSRIVAMTASVMHSDRRAALDAGMDDFVSKPVRIEDLRDAILRSVSSRKQAGVG